MSSSRVRKATLSVVATGLPVAPFDSDTHLYEPRDLWAGYADPARRHLALQILDDDLGHAWLVDHRGHRIQLAEIHQPGDVEAQGAYRRRVRDGLGPEVPYDEALPREYWDPSARLALMDRWGMEASVLFPNFGLLWERALEDDLAALLTNMTAWNRHAAAVAAEGAGRLFPTGHVSLRDLDWLEDELAGMSAAGVRLAMVGPALVDGKPLSHPDLDRAWAAFVEHGVSPVFHVASFPHPFDPAWYEPDDPLEVGPVLSSVFIWTAPALALADMALNGVFERHPDLRVGVMELSAAWVPMFLMYLDGGLEFVSRFDGVARRRLSLRPSEYVRRQVRVAAFSYEQPSKLIHQSGDLYMYCSDWPHAEGLASPVEGYVAEAGALPGRAGERLYAGNLRWLVGLEA